MFNIHHMSLSVSDLARSIQFYNCFGFKECLQWVAPDHSVQIAHLKLSNFFLELFCYQHYILNDQLTANLESSLPILGIKHLALQVSSLIEAKKFLLQNGFAQALEIKKGKTGIDYLFIRDPDGIFIEIVEDKRAFNV